MRIAISLLFQSFELLMCQLQGKNAVYARLVSHWGCYIHSDHISFTLRYLLGAPSAECISRLLVCFSSYRKVSKKRRRKEKKNRPGSHTSQGTGSQCTYRKPYQVSLLVVMLKYTPSPVTVERAEGSLRAPSNRVALQCITTDLGITTTSC